MFKTRLVSGIVVAAIMLLFAWLGGPYLSVFLMCVSIVGLNELYRATGVLKEGKYINTLTATGYGGTVLYYMTLLCCPDVRVWLFVIVLVFIASMAVYVFTFPKYAAANVAFSFFGFFYVSVMLGFIYLTRAQAMGIYMVWLIFFSSWFCDVFAYLTGMLLGKHKLAPVLSPKKSIEGAIGGIVFPAFFGALYGFLIKRYALPDFPVVASAALSGIGAGVSQIGDLGASAIKRNFEIKDYGNIIPGHGGILDRFDSVIFTAPMVYFISYFMRGFWGI